MQQKVENFSRLLISRLVPSTSQLELSPTVFSGFV